ncbi:MAG: hypothetical protein Q8920_10670 [Bacillota bacterium]|nr:hypothetical protein [Bacillota bacterium]
MAVIAGIALFGSWMLRTLIDFTQNLFLNMGHYIK